MTALSWIPSEAIGGSTRLPFDMGVAHYDDPPPDVIDDLDVLHKAGAFRFANELKAWVEIEDGRIVDAGRSGRALLSNTHMKVGPMHLKFQPTGFPIIAPEPDWGAEWARFEQTAGGRPGMPAPRLVRHKPFVQLIGPTVWTSLALTIRADGTSTFELTGASPFPRHWIYDKDRRLVAKAGLTDFHEWYTHAFGVHSPWGEENSPAMMTLAETAMERQLATTIMRGGAKPSIRKVAAGDVIVTQGEPGEDLFLLVDGIASVSVDGEPVAELGPGAIIGERALLEGGVRTSTITAVTNCKLAVARAEEIDLGALAEVAASHRREDAGA